MPPNLTLNADGTVTVSITAPNLAGVPAAVAAAAVALGWTIPVGATK